ncbi:hypothetical protein [Clostridium beijerinckii]|uniref:hypothetical protein n=1 Tax=Clostridium beijerinckii TaxID=1520 RepID=UPI00047DAA8A|nr:hypothetical protein [Clostridium beijerinckii]
MNGKAINKSSFKLVTYTTNKNISLTKVSKGMSKILIYAFKICKSVFNLLFSNLEYMDTQNTAHSRGSEYNYDITDATELKLIASRRTFL